MRGYFGIGVEGVSKARNMGALMGGVLGVLQVALLLE